MHRLWSKAALVVGLGVLASLPARSAAAQDGLLPTPTTTNRDFQDIDDHPDWVNRQDCIADAMYTFRLGSTGTIPSTSNLHVWASTADADCTVPDTRDGSSCKQVFQANVYAGSLQTITAEVKVRDIIRVGSGPLTMETPETVCDEGIDLQEVELQFFVVSTGGTVLPGVTLYTVQYDLVGPPPPTSVTAGIGEEAVVVKWKPSTSDELLPTYDVFVDEAGGGDPGAGGAGGASSDPCSSDVLIPGQIPTGTAKTTTNASTTEAEADGLQNGVLYAVGVATVDAFNNPGPLSTLACATPENVTGFFEAYRAAGGEGGGGFCSVGAVPSRLAAAFMALAALGLAVRRRRGGAETRRSS